MIKQDDLSFYFMTFMCLLLIVIAVTLFIGMCSLQDALDKQSDDCLQEKKDLIIRCIEDTSAPIIFHTIQINVTKGCVWKNGVDLTNNFSGAWCK